MMELANRVILAVRASRTRAQAQELAEKREAAVETLRAVEEALREKRRELDALERQLRECADA